MKWIALHGPIGSGKTTLARALEDTHLLINFGDLLKEKALLALHPFKPISMRELLANKEQYRPFLQTFGDAIGWTTESKYVFESLEEWERLGCPPCVFDNVRSPEQAKTLREKKFYVLKLEVPEPVLATRRQPTAQALAHSIERPLPDNLVDVKLNAALPISELVDVVRSL